MVTLKLLPKFPYPTTYLKPPLESRSISKLTCPNQSHLQISRLLESKARGLSLKPHFQSVSKTVTFYYQPLVQATTASCPINSALVGPHMPSYLVLIEQSEPAKIHNTWCHSQAQNPAIAFHLTHSKIQTPYHSPQHPT